MKDRLTLTDKEKLVLDLRLGRKDEPPMSLREAGKALGVGRERVRQIEEKALRKLRCLGWSGDKKTLIEKAAARFERRSSAFAPGVSNRYYERPARCGSVPRCPSLAEQESDRT